MKLKTWYINEFITTKFYIFKLSNKKYISLDSSNNELAWLKIQPSPDINIKETKLENKIKKQIINLLFKG